MADCKIIYAPERGELTGLVRMGETPWDQPHTWWLDVLATWPIDPPDPLLAGLRYLQEPWPDPRRSRTDGLLLPVRMEDPGQDVLQEAGRILTRLGASEAVVCHVRPPLDAETTMALQELNAKLVKYYRAVPDVRRRLAQIEEPRSGQRKAG